MAKPRYSPEEKQKIIEQYKSGELSQANLKSVYGMYPDTIYKWIQKYELYGIGAFQKGNGNSSYTKEFKMQCVKEYLLGKGSLLDICANYNISSASVLKQWIECYKANKELVDYNPKSEVYMAEAKRKVTREERKEIVEYCIRHSCNYKDTAAKFDVSYSQVYLWVKKYVLSAAET
ncbi:transposase [Hungatella hathewayi]|uniref:transposase n=1 Tax=Hungatella hathewayi TaxID=154046 RepID=UPI00356962B8